MFIIIFLDIENQFY